MVGRPAETDGGSDERIPGLNGTQGKVDRDREESGRIETQGLLYALQGYRCEVKGGTASHQVKHTHTG